jgi:hypothetical protein
VAWQWVNANIDKESFTLLKQDYHWAMFYTCNGFFLRMGKFEKTNSKTFLYKIIESLSMEDLVTFGNLLSIKFMETNRRLYATPGK